MIGLLVLATVDLITLHMIDGRVVQINPLQVVQLRHDHPTSSNKVLPAAVLCVVRFTDGTFLSVIETCDDVRKLMEGTP